MERVDLSNVKEPGKRLEPGAYVCKILKVDDVPNSQYLLVEFDIAEGDHRGFYAERQAQNPDWKYGGVMYLSYKESVAWAFKRTCSNICKSNPGYVFNPDSLDPRERDEKTLVGKMLGIVICYQPNSRTGKRNLKPHFVTYTVQDVRDGKWSMPKDGEKRDLETNASAASFVSVPDNLEGDEVPFT